MFRNATIKDKLNEQHSKAEKSQLQQFISSAFNLSAAENIKNHIGNDCGGGGFVILSFLQSIESEVSHQLSSKIILTIAELHCNIDIILSSITERYLILI